MAAALVSVDRISQALNVSIRRVNQLTSDGLPRESRGQYDLGKCMLWYIRYLQNALSSKASLDDDGELVSTKHQRSALLALQVERERLALAKERGEVLAIADYEQRLSHLIIETKARIMSVGPRVAPLLVGESSRMMIQATIEKAHKEALSHLATMRFPPPIEPPVPQTKSQKKSPQAKRQQN